jgi:outer membrane protein TolC
MGITSKHRVDATQPSNAPTTWENFHMLYLRINRALCSHPNLAGQRLRRRGPVGDLVPDSHIRLLGQI